MRKCIIELGIKVKIRRDQLVSVLLNRGASLRVVGNIPKLRESQLILRYQPCSGNYMGSQGKLEKVIILRKGKSAANLLRFN
jgi:hypothetical protein